MKTTIYILLALLLVVPMAEAKDYGPFVYSTVVVGGQEDDTLLVPALYYWAGSATVVGKYLYVSSTTDGLAPQNEACQILAYTASSGTIILDQEVEGAGNDASLGLSATITLNDIVWIMDAPPTQALIRKAVTATKPATGVAPLDYSLYISNIADSVEAEGELIRASTDSLQKWVGGADGATWGTPTEPAAGVNIMEGLGNIDADVDTLVKGINGADGATWGTAAEPAAGVNLYEGVGFLQDQVDTITTVKLEYAEDMAESTRDSLSYLHKLFWGAAGLPALTGTRLAAGGGVSAGEGLLFMSDAIDTINAVKLEYAEDMQEGIRDSLEDANDHLQALRGVTTGFVDASVWQYVTVIVNFAAAGAWEEAASTHELFTVTGAVEFEITAYCSTDVAVTSADSIFFLNGGDVGVAAAGSVYRCLGTDIDAFEGLFRGVRASTGAAVIPTAAILAGNGGDAWCGTSMGGMDIGYDIDDNDFTGGIIVFYCKWRPITTSSTVVAGLGGAL